MNGLLVSGETAHQNLQIEIEFKPEVKNDLVLMLFIQTICSEFPTLVYFDLCFAVF